MPFNWRKYVPFIVKKINKRLKKRLFYVQMKHRIKNGRIWKADDIIIQLQQAKISKGDHLMVHASMSKIGALEHGPTTVIQSLMHVVGPEGIILMPTSPINGLQYDYVQKKPTFDVAHTASAMGAISEAFRKFPDVQRSLHPTESVAAWGQMSNDYIMDHLTQNTPYHIDSPYGKLIRNKGKILYIGVTLDNAGTHLHTLEDALDVGLAVYTQEVFTLEVIDKNRHKIQVKTKVHNPTYSKKRKCDELLPLFLSKGVYQEVKIGNAKTLIFDAELMFNVMIDAFLTRGVTMYNPHGIK
jgi:aminoglycoside 3-N-acetyltransferase